MRFQMFVAAVAAGVAFAGSAHAGIIADPTRAALNADNTVDWSLFGSDNTGLSTPVFKTVGSESVGVASSSGALDIKRQSISFDGNFQPGAYLLYQPNLSDSFIVNFSKPVSAVGTQIQDFHMFGAFGATMEFFDASDNLLGKVTVNGDSTNAANNTAVFIGGTSTSADISFVEFTVSDTYALIPNHGNIAINQLSFDLPTDVPEPMSLALLGAGLGGFAFLRRRRGR